MIMQKSFTGVDDLKAAAEVSLAVKTCEIVFQLQATGLPARIKGRQVATPAMMTRKQAISLDI